MRRLLPTFALLCVAVPAEADVGDYERARAALERGDVRPLATILVAVEKEVGGRIIEVDFELEDGRYLYEFELVTADGRLLEATVDAATGRILAVEEDDDD